MLQTKTAVLPRVSNIGVQLLQNLLSQMIIVPKSLKLRHWLQNIEEVNIRASSLCFFWRGDMKPCSRHKETPVEGRTCQQSRNLKNAVCVSAGEKKQTTQLDPWKLLTLQGTKPYPLWKGKSLTQKSRLVGDICWFMLVSSKAVLGKWLFHQTSFKKLLLRVPGMIFV